MRGVVAAIVTVLSFASAAAAEPPTGLVFSYNEDAAGGLLLGYPVPDGSWGAMSWQACPPDAPCYDVAPDSTSDHILHVGSVPAGTVFRATATEGDQSIAATSDAYQGPVRVVRPPGISGQLRVGHVVGAVPAVWSGGWGAEQPFVQLQACRTKRSSSCRVIASTYYWERCAGVGAILPRRYEGWYLRVADSRFGRQIVFPAFAVRRPEDLSPLVASGTTAVRTVGRIRRGRLHNRAC